MEKPIVFFANEAIFDTEMFKGAEVAHVYAIKHTMWGSGKVRTSEVLYKFDDGSFETRNTIYKPTEE